MRSLVYRGHGLLATMNSAILPVLIGGLLIVSACAPTAPVPAPTTAPTKAISTATSPPTATPAAAAVKPAAAPLTLDALKNAEYPSDFPAGGKARLSDGKYVEEIAPGAASRLVITLHPVYAMGDLNGDGADDAAAILVANSGGSGTFSHLVAVLNEGGKPKPVAVALLGDRVKVEALSIKSGEIVIEMVIQGPQDPLCCPTQKTTRSFKLQGDKLV